MLVQIIKTAGCIAAFTLLLLAGSCQKEPDYTIELDSTDVVQINKPNRGLVFFDIERNNIFTANEVKDCKEIIVSIENENGQFIKNMEVLKLQKQGNSFISDTLALKLGKYRVSRVFCTAADNKIYLASPLIGSPEAEQVDMPLNLYFNLTLNDTLAVVKPNLREIANKKPADFGFSEAFEVVEGFPLMLTVMAYNQNLVNYELVTATIKVSDSNTGNYYTIYLSAHTQYIYIKNNIELAEIEITKAGYATQKILLPYNQLENYKSKPLIILLNKI